MCDYFFEVYLKKIAIAKEGVHPSRGPRGPSPDYTPVINWYIDIIYIYRIYILYMKMLDKTWQIWTEMDIQLANKLSNKKKVGFMSLVKNQGTAFFPLVSIIDHTYSEIIN